MLHLARAPGRRKGGKDFSYVADRRRIRIALQRDQRRSAGWMCCGEQRSCCERADEGDKDRVTNSEIVEYRGYAVSPLLQGGQCRWCDRIGRSCAGLIEEDHSTQR